jgi:hypothetical protein
MYVFKSLHKEQMFQVMASNKVLKFKWDAIYNIIQNLKAQENK